jgi:hypothetical protein
MGRKSVRKNELFRSGGLLSFPRTGCALRASVILTRGQKSHDIGLQSLVTSGWLANRKLSGFGGGISPVKLASRERFLLGRQHSPESEKTTVPQTAVAIKYAQGREWASG